MRQIQFGRVRIKMARHRSRRRAQVWHRRDSEFYGGVRHLGVIFLRWAMVLQIIPKAPR